jgi:hypothetical protein
VERTGFSQKMIDGLEGMIDGMANVENGKA